MENLSTLEIGFILGVLTTLFLLYLVTRISEFILRAFKDRINSPAVTVTTNSGPPAEPKTIAAKSKSSVKEKPEPPGKSCGHCGTRIQTLPVRGIALGEDAYSVYQCPACKKETFLPA